MSRRSSIAHKPTLSGIKETSTMSEESGIQKHVQFWDKKDKGYITPLDIVSGFMTLGYSVVFSIVLGTVVGVFLSFSTQTGWIPDPLCRSNVRNLIMAKKQTQCNQGAFDENGVLDAEKFDSLFNKYAKFDKSGNTITMTELMRMTKEQEGLGNDVKAWTASLIELCTVYFLIGRWGSLKKEDIRAAYDGTLFYRLKDAHRLMIKQGTSVSMESSKPGLGGAYLASSHGVLSLEGIEHRLQSFITQLQSRSSAVMADYRLRDWISYIQESFDSIKKSALPRLLMRPSAINGVLTPKASFYRNINNKQPEDPSSLFSDGLTGVAKPDSDTSLVGSADLLNSLLQSQSEDEIASSKETYKISNFDDGSEHVLFRYLNENKVGTPISLTEDIVMKQPVPKKSISTNTSNGPLMSRFLRDNETENDYNWLGEGLTGVQGSYKRADSPTSRTIHAGGERGNMENVSSKKVTHIPVEESPPPPQLIQNQPNDVPKAAITPPPEEKIFVDQNKVKKIHVNNKKVNKRKNRNSNASGRLSPTTSSESGQEFDAKPAITPTPVIDAK